MTKVRANSMQKRAVRNSAVLVSMDIIAKEYKKIVDEGLFDEIVDLLKNTAAAKAAIVLTKPKEERKLASKKIANELILTKRILIPRVAKTRATELFKSIGTQIKIKRFSVKSKASRRTKVKKTIAKKRLVKVTKHQK